MTKYEGEKFEHKVSFTSQFLVIAHRNEYRPQFKLNIYDLADIRRKRARKGHQQGQSGKKNELNSFFLKCVMLFLYLYLKIRSCVVWNPEVVFIHLIISKYIIFLPMFFPIYFHFIRLTSISFCTKFLRRINRCADRLFHWLYKEKYTYFPLIIMHSSVNKINYYTCHLTHITGYMPFILPTGYHNWLWISWISYPVDILWIIVRIDHCLLYPDRSHEG
jgi:hypothetical protein